MSAYNKAYRTIAMAELEAVATEWRESGRGNPRSDSEKAEFWNRVREHVVAVAVENLLEATSDALEEVWNESVSDAEPEPERDLRQEAIQAVTLWLQVDECCDDQQWAEERIPSYLAHLADTWTEESD